MKPKIKLLILFLFLHTGNMGSHFPPESDIRHAVILILDGEHGITEGYLPKPLGAGKYHFKAGKVISCSLSRNEITNL